MNTSLPLQCKKCGHKTKGTYTEICFKCGAVDWQDDYIEVLKPRMGSNVEPVESSNLKPVESSNLKSVQEGTECLGSLLIGAVVIVIGLGMLWALVALVHWMWKNS